MGVLIPAFQSDKLQSSKIHDPMFPSYVCLADDFICSRGSADG
jgi:hypothetical protein